MLTTFVRRPVLSAVISILLSILGVLALASMPMTLFPNIAPPEVNVTVEYTGANAETVIKAAIVPLERAINGVPKMKYMSSDAGNDGVGVIQILFEAGTDSDVAAINVQNRVNAVIDELPSEVLKNGVKIAKEENAMLMYLSIHSSDPEHDEKFLYNFADINILAELKRIDGIGFADILGAKEYAMRIWLKPDKLLAYDVSPEEVLEALDAYNLEAAPGKIGENSDRAATPLQYTLAYTGKLRTEDEYAGLPIRSTPDGQLLRLRDVADVELGTAYFDVEAKFNGRPAASLLLKQQPGSNARDVINEVKKRLAVIADETFLPGMSYDVSFDVSRFLDASVHEVIKTLLEAFVLVALVVFLFLQDARSTLIPVLAVPVSLVGSLVFTAQLGFSLNLITLFALVLSIGIVVDNAIVVVEAVHHKIHSDHLAPREASEQALREIGPAIIAITLVMASVFIPLAFIDGPAGIFYELVGLQASWEADLWGRLRGLHGATRARYLASVEAARLVMTQLVAEIAIAYFELFALDHASAILSETIERQAESVDLMKIQKQAGRANELAIQQLAAQLATTRALLADTRRHIREVENQLNQLAGRLPQPVARSKDRLQREVPATIAAGVPSSLLARRPDIREAELAVQAARLDVGVARAAFYPRLTISAHLGYQAFDPRFLLSTPASLAYGLVGGLVAPLVNRRGIAAAHAAAEASQIEAMYRYQSVVLRGFVEVASGLYALEQTAEVVAQQRQKQVAVAGAVDAADMLFRAGQANYLDVLLAQQSTLDAQLELIRALRDQQITVVRVYRALGGGWRGAPTASASGDVDR